MNPSLRTIVLGPNGIRAGWRFAIFAALVALLRWLLRLLPLGPAPSLEALEAGPIIVTRMRSFMAFAFAAWVMSRIEKRHWGDYGLPIRRAASRETAMGFLWGFSSLSLLMLALRIAGCYRVEGLALRGGAIFGFAAWWAVAFLLVALLEEFSLRGYALNALASGIGFWPAAVLVSAVFLLLHVMNPGETWSGLADVFIIGVFFCFTLRRTGTLWFAVAAHAAWDWGLSYLYSVPDSGFMATGHLLDVHFGGPAWLSGGTAGPEGSVLNLVAHLLFFPVFSRLYPEPRQLGRTPAP